MFGLRLLRGIVWCVCLRVFACVRGCVLFVCVGVGVLIVSGRVRWHVLLLFEWCLCVFYVYVCVCARLLV